MNDRLNEKVKFTSNAVIKVIGVGGGGGNALNTMIESGLGGVDFIAANTDVQALQSNLAPIKIQLGRELTKGLGAGANPDTGRNAALEDKAILQEVLGGADMVFVTGGMGGGTGTGAAPIIAQVARELGALTVGVVTKPFTFEGKRRKHQSELGIQTLRASVDTLITIPNQRLLSIAPPEMSMLEGFKLADEVLLNAVKGISDIINIPGRVNVDFADVKTIMSEMGMALMGIGHATGPNRAAEAARAAINSPLLEDIDIEGATGILINITGTSSMTLHEISEASTLIQEAAHEDANIIFGAVIDEHMGEEIRVTVIATGFDQARVSFPEQQQHNIPFASIPQQTAQFMQAQNIPIVAQQAQNSQTPAFAGMNSQRPQPIFNNQSSAYDSRSVVQPQSAIQQSFVSPTIANAQQNAFNRISQQSQYTQQTAQGLNRNQDASSYAGLNSSANYRANNQQPGVGRERHDFHSPISANWTNQQQSQIHQQANQENDDRNTNEQKVIGASAQNANEHNNNDNQAEAALKLARELSDIEIDDTDFDTPAFMRRKDDHKNI